MEFAIFAFLAVFLLIASGGLLLFYREVMLQRISEVIHPRPKEKSIGSVVQQAKSSIGTLMESVENLMPRSDKEVSIVVQRLTRAGYRNESAVKVFYGCKVAAPILLSALALVTGLASFGPFFVYLMTLGVGFLAPDFWLGKKIKKRQKKINRGLPDVLDLLVICMEAGLSLDQAMMRVSEEMDYIYPELANEFATVVMQVRAGQERGTAFNQFVRRTGIEDIKSLAAMIIQSEKFGTSLAQALKVYADALRTRRRLRAEQALLGPLCCFSASPRTNVAKLVLSNPLIRLCFRLLGIHRRGYDQFLHPCVVDHIVRLPNLPVALEGVTILQMSDLHLDLDSGFVPALAKHLDGLSYDLAVITGDFRNLTAGPHESAVAGTIALLQHLHAPVYAVPGNHDGDPARARNQCAAFFSSPKMATGAGSRPSSPRWREACSIR